MLSGTRLAVWGDPIDHSRSPALHAAAYRELGLPWEYGRQRVTEADFPAALGNLDTTWRGLSLTMPLKNVAARSAASLDDAARRTRVALDVPEGPEAAAGAPRELLCGWPPVLGRFTADHRPSHLQPLARTLGPLRPA